MKLRAAVFVPVMLTVMAFVLVLRSGTTPAPLWRTELPDEASRASRCTWHCHNHGCPHRPALPGVLTADDQLFGWTVRALHRAGRLLVPGAPAIGYCAANLAVFCVAWPGAMLAMWLGALRARAARERLEGSR